MARDKVDEILRKYGGEIEKSAGNFEDNDFSSEYMKFKREISPELSFYEKMAKGVGGTFKLKLSQADERRIQSAIDISHLEITPADAAGFAITVFVSIIFLSLALIAGLFLAGINMPIFLMAILFFIAVFVYFYVSKLPERLAQRWRLKASAQMVPAILYMVIYMKHTSNLERAISFAAAHLQPPLSLDLRKVIWDVETGKYSSVKVSLDAYLENWRGYSLEFVEAMHLMEGSLYEPIESRRIEILEKALSVMLDGVYDKMLKFTHNVQSPLTNLYMLGIVLPTLAIALLPLGSTLLGGSLKWWHVAIGFNILVPFFVYYYATEILSKRPGGYGESDLLELNPDYPYYKSKKHAHKALWIAVPLFLLGLIPLVFQYTSIPGLLGLQKDYPFEQLGVSVFSGFQAFGFMEQSVGKFTGPFGLLALLLSFFIPLSIALFFAISYKSRTKKLIETRDKTKQLEQEFSSSLFQLGNRLGDGIPAELAFGRVAESLKGTSTEGFFSLVNSNILQFGMSVRRAIFDKKRGAIIYYPSNLVQTSMEILIESVSKGLRVAANALTSISEYLKNIQKINERLKDLLADIISSMKSNMSFLAPLLAGIVVGLSAMITAILTKLQVLLSVPGGADTSIAGFGTVGSLTQLFNLANMIPPYYIQLIVGIYVVEIIYILTITLVMVESGVDPLSEKYEISKNMKSGIIMYLGAALFATLVLSAMANIAIGGL